MSGTGGSFDVDLIAAQLRMDAADVDSFAEPLASKLEAMIPGRVRITRRRSGLAGPKLVRGIAVEGSGRRLLLLRDGDSWEMLRARVSGGIVIAREQLDADTWLADVVDLVHAEAARNTDTRQALERLLLS